MGWLRSVDSPSGYAVKSNGSAAGRWIQVPGARKAGNNCIDDLGHRPRHPFRCLNLALTNTVAEVSALFRTVCILLQSIISLETDKAHSLTARFPPKANNSPTITPSPIPVAAMPDNCFYWKFVPRWLRSGARGLLSRMASRTTRIIIF